MTAAPDPASRLRQINTLTVIMMQVPCWGGLLTLALKAAAAAKRKVPIKSIVVGLQGEVLSEEWVTYWATTGSSYAALAC